MHWSLSSLLTLGLGLGAAASPAPRDAALDTRQSAPPLATWFWETDVTLPNASSVDKLVAFVQKNGVSRVYAQVNPDLSNQQWKDFIGKCTAAGIAVDALFGNRDWVTGTGSPSLASQLSWIDQFQKSAGAGTQFSGLHADVEPWTFGDFDTNRAYYLNGWQNVINQIVDFGKSHGLPVAADLAFWANEMTSPTTGETMDIWMLKRLDSATFMTYRDTAAGVSDLGTRALKAGQTTGKKVWLAVETTQVDPSYLSYYGKSAATLRADLVEIGKLANTYSSMAGIGVHSYLGWTQLKA